MSFPRNDAGYSASFTVELISLIESKARSFILLEEHR